MNDISFITNKINTLEIEEKNFNPIDYNLLKESIKNKTISLSSEILTICEKGSVTNELLTLALQKNIDYSVFEKLLSKSSIDALDMELLVYAIQRHMTTLYCNVQSDSRILCSLLEKAPDHLFTEELLASLVVLLLATCSVKQPDATPLKLAIKKWETAPETLLRKTSQEIEKTSKRFENEIRQAMQSHNNHAAILATAFVKKADPSLCKAFWLNPKCLVLSQHGLVTIIHALSWQHMSIREMYTPLLLDAITVWGKTQEAKQFYLSEMKQEIPTPSNSSFHRISNLICEQVEEYPMVHKFRDLASKMLDGTYPEFILRSCAENRSALGIVQLLQKHPQLISTIALHKEHYTICKNNNILEKVLDDPQTEKDFSTRLLIQLIQNSHIEKTDLEYDAKQQRLVTIAQFLIANGANMNATTKTISQPTPLLFTAIQRKLFRLIHLFIENGANLNCIYLNKTLCATVAESLLSSLRKKK